MPSPVSLLRALVPAVALSVGSLAATEAEAFCGFYVSGADQELYNNATMVVLMRDGTRTVVAMQNNYEGPPEEFAMVVPVPVVLRKREVRTLPREVFDRVDQLGAPRLVEYWEQDPCYTYDASGIVLAGVTSAEVSYSLNGAAVSARDRGVKIEAEFDVGEYQIVILSAKDSGGLDTWLRENGYKIPKGAEAALRPYVAEGMKFFVAKVNPKKVRFKNGQATLSPLRFHYDSDTFKLPIRLGMLNADGPQDLIVNVLAREVRYAVANRENYSIPTNLDVNEATRANFGKFYATLFDRVLEKHPGAVVTEYAWQAGSCDPCPVPGLQGEDLVTLGADVLPSYEAKLQDYVDDGFAAQLAGEFVLTRMHARYGPQDAKDDLVFAAASGITGGREFLTDGKQLEQGAQPADFNNFQARYAIRHPWKGPIKCDDPVRGVWGGPPAGYDGSVASGPAVARDLAFASRDADLDAYLTQKTAVLDEDGVSVVLAKADVDAPKPTGKNLYHPGDIKRKRQQKREKKEREAGNDGAGAAGCQGKSQPPVASLGALLLALGIRRRRRRNG